MRRLLGAMMAVLCLSAHSIQAAAGLADMFANRELVTDKSGSVRGSTVGATREPFEPRHGGKLGAHSVWISWKAPSTGIVTWDTVGSGFDTLLSVYTLDTNNPTKPALDRLREVARADDNGASLDSQVQFGVQAGVTYEVAVDGYNGASGDLRLRWDLLSMDQPPPVILQVPPDRALKAGDTVTLTVEYQAGKDVKLAWLFNGDDTLGVESGTLVLPNFQPANVGRYQLRITAGSVRMVSVPIELQINSEGEILTLARDKLLDAVESSLIGRREDAVALQSAPRAPGRGSAALAAIGLTRGYNGSQIFSTIYANRDVGEPLHCGVVGGASYWLAYQAPANGSMTVDTDGSSFDTVLAVYTYNPPLTGYQGLIPVTCDNNNGANGTTSRVTFQTVAGQSYLFAVDGVNGARGTAHLNYQLAEASSGTPPVILSPPDSRTVEPGTDVSWLVQATGTTPFTFQWFKDGAPIPGEIQSRLTLKSVSVEASGRYSLRVTNVRASVFSAEAVLRVLPLQISIDAVTNPKSRSLVFTLPWQSGAHYLLESIDSLSGGTWIPQANGVADSDLLVVRLPMTASSAGFFRFRSGTAAGAITPVGTPP